MTQPFYYQYLHKTKESVSPFADIYMNVHCNLICYIQNLETTKCPPAVEWINKLSNTHLVKHYSSIKKNELLKYTNNMDESHERSQTK